MAQEHVQLVISSTASSEQYVVPDQVIGVFNSTTVSFGQERSVGIIGLGFPRLSQLARIGLGAGQPRPRQPSSSSMSFSSSSSSTQETSTQPTEIVFTILPVEPITTTDVSGQPEATIIFGDKQNHAAAGVTPTAVSPLAAAATPSSSPPPPPPIYYPPLLENLFNPHGSPRSNSTPESTLTPPPLSYPVFGLALSNSSAPYSSRTANASITFGGVSSEYIDTTNSSSSGRTLDDIEWHDVVPYGRANGYDLLPSSPTLAENISLADLDRTEYIYWTLELAQVTFNGTPIELTPTYSTEYTGVQGPTALLDVGTNGLFAPQQDVVELFSHIEKSRQVSDGQWAVPCDTRATLTFQFAHRDPTTGGVRGPGRVISLQPSEWMYAQITDGGAMCLAWPVVAPPSSDSDWQLGTPFLRKVYTVFGYGIDGVQNPLVGFLPLPEPSMTTMATTTTTDAYNPTPTSIQQLDEIRSHLTITIPTTLPNILLPDPAYSTPAYLFNTSAGVPTVGSVQTIGLADARVYSVGNVPVVTAVSQTATATPIPPQPTASKTGGGDGGGGGGSNDEQDTGQGEKQDGDAAGRITISSTFTLMLVGLWTVLIWM